MKKLLLLITGLVIAGSAWSADEWLKLRPVSTDTRVSYPADAQKNNAALDRVLANYREGMTLTYSSASTIVVTAGEIVCSNSDGSLRKMRKNPSSTNVTFSDIDTGAEASSTTYYIYANCDADATTATFKISASSTAPTGITSYKRLGSFYNDSSSNISQGLITNDNNYFSASSYDSGWFSVGSSSSYSKTHNLGTTKLSYSLFYSASSDGSNPSFVRVWSAENGYNSGPGIAISTTTATITTGAQGIHSSVSGGSISNITSGYYRLVLTAI